MADLFKTLAQSAGAAADFDTAMDALADTVQALGFPRVAYAYIPVPRMQDGRWLPPPVTVRNYPTGWDKQWERHCPHDPYYHACFETTLSVDWNRVQQRDSLNGTERDSWNYLADTGLSQGVTMPIHLPGGRFAYLSAVGDLSDAEWEKTVSRSRESLFVVAHLFHDVVGRRFGGPSQVARLTRLSPRELECLQWAAQGKTAGDIACILDRSVETIRLHLKHATTKLNATNRSHAVAKAAAFGLITV